MDGLFAQRVLLDRRPSVAPNLVRRNENVVMIGEDRCAGGAQLVDDLAQRMPRLRGRLLREDQRL
jgi:hypothetical protein